MIDSKVAPADCTCQVMQTAGVSGAAFLCPCQEGGVLSGPGKWCLGRYLQAVHAAHNFAHGMQYFLSGCNQRHGFGQHD